MASITLKTAAGKDAGNLDLDASVFGVQPNVPLMHQVVTAQLAARRSGTQSTKTRAEVRGGGKKPFKQKGTGNARQGSTRSPHMSGGGVAHGPKPRKYDQKTPKKMIKAALRSALSDRAADGKIIVIDSWSFTAPKTKDAKLVLSALGIEGKALVVVDIDDTNTIKSFLNLPDVQLIESRELNAYDVLCSDYVVFSQSTLPGEAVVSDAPVKKAAAKKTAAPKEAPAKVATLVDADVAKDDTAADAADDDAAAKNDTAAAEPAAPTAKELPAGAVAANDDGSAPEGYDIKGNADSMLYHLPDTAFYNRTVAEVWFASAEAAEAAGFQLPPSQRKKAEEAAAAEDGAES
jgi:large subunit ribosomal protein L4